MIDTVLVDILYALLERSPTLAVLGVVAWQLRKDLRDCILHSQELLDILFKERLSD
jgi:hypothetical protein